MRIRVNGDTSLSVFHGIVDDGLAAATIDMSGLRFALPPVIATAGAMIHYLRETGWDVEFLPPVGDPARYLERMNFGRLLDQFDIAHALPKVTHHDRATQTQLCELTMIDPANFAALPALVFDRIEDLGLDAKLSEEVYGALYELANNAVTHANTSCAYLTAQTYPNRIELCVADMGRGILASFVERAGQRHQPTTHKEAIELAVGDRVSSLGTDRGIGLSNLIRFIGMLDGRVSILSGDTQLNFASGMPKGSFAVPSCTRGAIVSVVIPLVGRR